MKRLALVVATTSFLAACSTTPVGPDYKVPADAVVQAPGATAPFVSADATVATPQGPAAVYSAEPLPARWWRLYQDPVLDRLIVQALAHNTDLRQASANLERVRAVENEADGARYPTIGVGVAPVYGHESGLDDLAPDYVPTTRGLYDAKLSLSYQVDVAGQIRRAIESAQAGSAAAQAGLDLVRINVAASTARAYAGVCSAGLRLQSAETSLRLQKEALDVSERLQQAGRVGALDTSRARSQLEQLNAMLPTLQAARRSGLFRLATLMGSLPRDFPAEVANCTQPPRVTSVLPVGDGAALLRRRPDVRQAERELAASTARIGVAVADLYPKISFGLSAVSAGPISDFGKRDTFAWNVGPLISWSVPNTGVVRARIAQAEATTRLNFAKFDGTVLTALRETETALDAYSHELDRQASLQAARDASATVAEQARRLYRGGRTGYLDALDAERSLAASEATLAASKAQLADDQIVLFLALGGGWEPGS
ncbi:MAG: efflux transporter, outer rane lipoprotein NodT family [Rhizobacter sp.]|nr:efflux transporter, outer rane lipoprotein NodT family [Rhizobacter sp.]